MSDHSNVQTLSASATHLPLSWYFDPAIHAIELERLFKHAPQYMGHRLMVPELGDFRVLESTHNAWALVHNPAGIELISNVCRHRQAIMLNGSGKLPGNSITCPLHRWSYSASGQLLGAPHFAADPCLHLPKKPLKEWHGLLFATERDIAAELAGMQAARDLDFTDYVLDRVDVHHYPFNWKTFIEVYLEDYHVDTFHPGLGNFVNCGDLRWEYGAHYSVQTVGLRDSLSNSGSPVYRDWQRAVKSYYGNTDPPHGAIWFTYYPNVMVEWYPHVLVVSTLLPRGPEACSNVVEFYYPDEIFHFEREFIQAEQAAYAETAVEDEEICQRMSDGRRALWREGREEHGPYQSPMEDGMKHFHAWMHREMAHPKP